MKRKMAPSVDERCKGLGQRKDFLKGFRSDDAQENSQYLQYNNKLINARVIDEIFSNANPHRQPASHRAIELVSGSCLLWEKRRLWMCVCVCVRMQVCSVCEWIRLVIMKKRFSPINMNVIFSYFSTTQFTHNRRLTGLLFGWGIGICDRPA